MAHPDPAHLHDECSSFPARKQATRQHAPSKDAPVAFQLSGKTWCLCRRSQPLPGHAQSSQKSLCATLKCGASLKHLPNFPFSGGKRLCVEGPNWAMKLWMFVSVSCWLPLLNGRCRLMLLSVNSKSQRSHTDLSGRTVQVPIEMSDACTQCSRSPETMMLGKQSSLCRAKPNTAGYHLRDRCPVAEEAEASPIDRRWVRRVQSRLQPSVSKNICA